MFRDGAMVLRQLKLQWLVTAKDFIRDTYQTTHQRYWDGSGDVQGPSFNMSHYCTEPQGFQIETN